MKAVLFPDNKLNVELCNIYNGYSAIVCQNTDRLRDFEHELPEIEAFRNDIQVTAFLNPRGTIQTRNYRGSVIVENADYENLISDVTKSGRISVGMYYNTNAWISPITGLYQVIPDYSSTTWTSAGASVFQNAEEGQPKPTRFPNHGKQMFDISNGDFGFDTDTGEIGISNLSEFLAWHYQQFSLLYNVKLSSISYMNGANAMHPLLLPYFLVGRNSSSNKYGDAPTDVSYLPNEREKFINYRSSTRCWDSAGGGSGDTVSWDREIGYAKEQIQKAILEGGIYTDFTHWHSVYSTETLDYFPLYFSEIADEISGQNVWKAGYGEAFEYYYLRELVRENCGIGSFESEGKVYVTIEVFDKFKNTSYNNVDRAVDVSLLKTPVSLKVNLTETSLAGKEISCKGASSIRSLGSNEYVLNIPYSLNEEGYLIVEIQETETSDYYSVSVPDINVVGNTITTDVPCKISIWRKPTAGEDWEIRNVFRNHDFETSRNYLFESGFKYYIGAISKYNHSSLIQTDL